jgi:endonuclease/exonuclease/phosphatase (EEP) superfamily protein YafD
VPTWSANTPFAIPIDHVLATSPLVITSRSVGPDVGSDHRPLDFVVGWAK